MFVAIMFVMKITNIGMIPLGFMNATTLHIPVIVGGIILGPYFGGALGAVFGFFSLWTASTNGLPTSFVFSPLVPVPGTGHGSWLALVIAFVPRILIGVTSYYAYKAVKKLLKNNTASIAAGAFVGSMTNTVFVMGLIYLLFKDAYGAVVNLGEKTVEAFILGTVVINGVPEAVVAVVISVAVCKALKAYLKE